MSERVTINKRKNKANKKQPHRNALYNQSTSVLFLSVTSFSHLRKLELGRDGLRDCLPSLHQPLPNIPHPQTHHCQLTRILCTIHRRQLFTRHIFQLFSGRRILRLGSFAVTAPRCVEHDEHMTVGFGEFFKAVRCQVLYLTCFVAPFSFRWRRWCGLWNTEG